LSESGQPSEQNPAVSGQASEVIINTILFNGQPFSSTTTPAGVSGHVSLRPEKTTRYQHLLSPKIESQTSHVR
jgi:hypothetical protein